EEIEKLKKQNESLQKLNQQLCVKVNDSRRKALEMGAQLDQAENTSKEEIKNLKLKMDLRGKGAQSTTVTAPQEVKVNIETTEPSAKTDQALTNIERLVAEIQSGFDSKD
ncbi:hypothetical protein N9W41_01480, partial [bacterium]|nr:hypothetical protein [bacterium]